jgi:perosamine synthetase
MANREILEVPWSNVGHEYTADEIQLVSDIMRNTRSTYTQGSKLNEFENTFCDYNKNKHAFAVSSCTAALELSALMSKVGPGDEVVIPGHTFCATAIPFGRTGAKIVWADIDPNTLVVTPETIEKVMTSKTKVIVVVHLYGLAADMDSIMELANKHNVLVVEDCAQSLGAMIEGKRVGTFGDFGCFSFHTHKNVTTLGEGGMLTVRDDNLAKVVPGLRHNGTRPYPEPREKYWVPAMSNVDFDWNPVWPYNFCIGEVQCALGAKLMGRVDQLIEKRCERALRFQKAVSDLPELVFQKIPEGRTSAHHLLPAKFDSTISGKTNHDFIETIWNEFKVKAIVQYYPLYRYPLFVKAGFGNADCPQTDLFFNNMVSFPFHSWMPEEQFDYMVHAVRETIKKLRS